MSITAGRCAAVVATSILFTACGGGGGSTGTPLPVIDDGRPDGFSGEPRTDFVLPYQTPDRGITTVQSGSFTGAVLRTTETPELAWLERVGQWDNGAVRQERPYQLIYLRGDRWTRLSLRDSASSPIDTGVREPGAVCSLTAMRSDYANPARGIMTYFAAGEDQQCFTTDDQVQAFRLDKTDPPTVLSTGTRSVPRIFRNPATGALTGVLIQDGTDLRLYDADLGGSRVIATGISGRAGFFGFSSTRLWASWSNGANRAVYRIDANGAVNRVFETTLGASITGSIGHQGGSLYFTHSPNSAEMPDEIVRLPMDGDAANVVHRAENIGQVHAVSANGLIYVSDFSTTGIHDVHLLSFGTSTTAATDTVVGTYSSGETTYFFSASATRDGRFMFSLRNVADDGREQRSARLVSPGHPAMSTTWPNSEWLGAVADDINLNTLDSEAVTHGVLVKAFSGDYRTSGHGGGTLTLYSFATNREYAGPVVPESSTVGTVSGTVSSPIGLTTLSTKTFGSDQDTIDIIGFNLRDFVAEQVTSTPGENESLNFP